MAKVGRIPRSDRKISFGKYKGQLISELPESYVRWLVENCELKPMILQSCLARLNQAQVVKESTAVDYIDMSRTVIGGVITYRPK